MTILSGIISSVVIINVLTVIKIAERSSFYKDNIIRMSKINTTVLRNDGEKNSPISDAYLIFIIGQLKHLIKNTISTSIGTDP